MQAKEQITALGKERKYALHENKQAFDIAIDTMRKYQKIQEIIDDYEGEGWERIAISDIREVVEDGNND